MVPRIGIELPDQARVVLDSELARGGGQWGRWVVAMVSVATIGSGIFGLGYRLLHLGFSQERISARTKTLQNWKKPAQTSGSDEPVDGQDEFDGESKQDLPSELPQLPSVPRSGTLDESPGERLGHRLASISTGRLAIIGAASLALIWNSVCVVLLAVAVSGWWYENPRPILAMLLLPFSGVAYWSLRSFLRQVRQIAGVGPTVLEISDHPLQPGGNYQLFISQMGRLRLRRLKIELICEEESFFRQGTDVRADQHVALSQELLSKKSVCVDPHAPWEQQLEFELPVNVMHSFCATNNSVRWRLVVSGEARPWPSFCRSFPVIVHPPLMVPPNSPR